MEFKPLNGTTLTEILSAFNESFSDYFTPFQLTEEQLKAKMLADKVNLDLSVGWFENGNLVAFILHGFDIINNEKVIYNGGTGVIPEKRGSGLTKQMYNFILPVLRENGINKVFLEVISENIQAIKSYERSGFKTEREVFCYKGSIEISDNTNNIEIRKLSNYNWSLMESFWDVCPTWQNSKNVVQYSIADNVSLGAYLQNELVGYLIFNPKSLRLQQIAVGKSFRQRKVASALIVKIIEEYGNTISIINVDTNSKTLIAFLEQIGFKKYIEQLEMKLIL